MSTIVWLAAVLFALGAGAVSAAGAFAIITMVGVVNRYAKVTRTAGNILLYEEMIIAGASLGNVAALFGFFLPVGILGISIFGLVGGIFVGCFSVCLAETVKAIPVFVRRSRITSGLGWVILSIAIGKGIGGLLYFLKLYMD